MNVTADDIAQLLASTPPRKVPDHVRRAVLGGRAGWLVLVFGLFFGTFGMCFVWMFFPWHLREDRQLDRSEHTAAGRVRTVTYARMEINDVRVMEYSFDYAVPGGKPREGTCYTTGERWKEGQEVEVRYLTDRPEIARIEGARLSQGGGIVAFGTLVFPLIGYGMVAVYWISRKRSRRLLEKGLVAEVDVKSIDATRMQVNYQTLYKITLSPLPGGNGQPVVIKRWAKPEINLLTQRALDKQTIYVLYDPRRLKSLIFPEALIGP